MSTQSAARPARIAVVEDNRADVYLLRRALQQAQVVYDCYHLPDGEAAIRFFLRQEPYCDAPRPDLLVLDVHLPRVDGFQVLQRLREQRVLHQIPVIALTTTSSSYDRAAMEALGIDHYVVKPFNLDAYMQVGQLIKAVLTARQPPSGATETEV